MPNTIILDEEVAVDKGRNLVDLIEQDIRARRGVIARRRMIRDLYHGSQDRILDYEGQSDIHLYVVTEKIEGVVPKIVNAFWNADPIVHVRPVGQESDIETTELNQVFMNWAIDADILDFYATTEQWFRNTVLDGVAVVKPWYKREERSTVIVQPAKIAWRAGEPDLAGVIIEDQDRLKSPEEILAQIFGDGSGLPDKGMVRYVEVDPVERQVNQEDPQASFIGQKFMVDFVEGRERYFGTLVEFVGSRYIDEIDVYIHRRVVTCNSPVVELVEFEDLIVPYRTSDLQSAERITHQYWLTFPQILEKIENEGWDLNEQDLDRLKSRAQAGEEVQQEHPENRQLSYQKDVQRGEQEQGQRARTLEPYVDNKILIFEVYCRDNITGQNATGDEVIYHIPYTLEKVVKAQFLEELFPHGRRPFIDLHNIRISDRFYSLSFGELLAPINIEVNAIMNMVNEGQEIINNPFFFYVPHANTVDPQVIKRVEPGQGIPVADVNAVSFPKFSQQPLANLQAMDTVLMFGDRLTLSPQSVGSSQVRNSPRTARGTLALLSEAGIKLDMLITSFQRGGWKELLRQIHGLYSHFGPDEKFFHVTGRPEIQKVSNEQLRGRFDYTFSGNTINTNREVMRTISQTRLITLLQDQAYAVDFNARIALIEDFLRHWGEGADVKKLLPKLPNQIGSHLPMDQASEIQVMVRGVPLEVLPTDNDIQHLTVLEKLQMSREFDMFPPETVALIASHAAAHTRQMQAKQAQGGQVPTADMANNVPRQAPGAMGDLQGGPT